MAIVLNREMQIKRQQQIPASEKVINRSCRTVAQFMGHDDAAGTTVDSGAEHGDPGGGRIAIGCGTPAQRHNHAGMQQYV